MSTTVATRTQEESSARTIFSTRLASVLSQPTIFQAEGTLADNMPGSSQVEIELWQELMEGIPNALEHALGGGDAE